MVISYPPELPVSQRRAEIARAIADHQVVILAGETGSGKTTQLPKICLELGRGMTGQIGHTQPRRIAARTVAERIAEELRTELGDLVGYQVRFTDRSSDATRVKLMTDGILLGELHHDRRLRRYDTLIIDEAHERSLNIDFILGYLHRLLPSRPDLKLIITSATIETQRFSTHFWDAPVIEVSGRTYPVEVRNRPLDGPEVGEPQDQVEAICDAVDELRAAGPGDILVFLSGEREIRDAAQALSGGGDEVLPLYARLSAAEQHRVFQPHGGPRIVLATNVAETSLTVPGVRYVIDPGTARISRYSSRTKVQRLPIEPVSQASANQRKGRCGRTSDGVCIRLYTEADFASRPEYTEPEILRTNLASVILRMAALGLGDVAGFPFLDPPDTRNVADGRRLLDELGAFRDGRLTDTGRQLARLPIDPRLGRMIIEAGRNGCVREVLVICAALAIQDPRERPADAREAADASHARFAEPGSDFLSLLNLWSYLRDKQRELSGSALRRMCRREYLHYLRVREWQDLYAQLRQAAAEIGVTTRRDQAGQQGDLAERVHRSLLAGLLSHIGMRDDAPRDGGKRRGPAEYLGARGVRYAIFPDTRLARRPPPWTMAAELVETSRLWARYVAAIEPEWAEPLAPHLVRRGYSEPRWEAERGAAVATETVTLYGLRLATRTVPLSRADPVLAREMFIQHALVEGEWQTHHRFFSRNCALLADARNIERKARRRGIVADDAALFEFYAGRIPADVVSARHFDSWWKKTRAADPDLLTLTEADLAGPAAGDVDPADYPDRLAGLDLSYEFSPGEPGDGVSVEVPLARLASVPADTLSWQVPGLREELIAELIRSLPKALRTRFVPAPDVAREVLARLDGSADLLTALAAELGRYAGIPVPREAFDVSKLPSHLRLRFRVVDDDGKALAEGEDLAELRSQLADAVRERVAAAAPSALTRTGITEWDVGTLPRVFESGQVRAYPALADRGDAVDVVLCEAPEAARRSMLTGCRRLLLLAVPSGVRAVASRLPSGAKLALSRSPYRSAGALLDDCAAAAADQIVAGRGGPVWDEAAFEGLVEAARLELRVRTADVVSAAAQVMTRAHEVEVALDRVGAAGAQPLAGAVADLRAQFAGLIYDGFVSATGARRLGDLDRYLRAMAYRLDRYDPGKDAERMAVVHRVAAEYERVASELSPDARAGEAAQAVGWMIEELRVSLFAQSLGVAGPVSERRVAVALARLGETRPG